MTASFDPDEAERIVDAFTERTGLFVSYTRNRLGAFEFKASNGFTCEYPWELEDYAATLPRTDVIEATGAAA